MKYSHFLSLILIASTVFVGCATKEEVAASEQNATMHSAMVHDCLCTAKPLVKKQGCHCDAPVLTPYEDIRINVVGQGVSPVNTTSPAQAYALAKRAAIADAYRLLAEKVKGVRVEGEDLIKNMMVTRSTIRTYVNSMIRDATIQETTFKEGLCEVQMQVVLSHYQFVR